MKKQISRSYNQQELKYICDLLCDNIEEVLSALDLHDYRDNGKMITMACPIHGGDNDSALNLYYEGDSYRGNWKCRTHGCEKIFKSSILGFIRGVISAQKYGWEKEGDEMCSFTEAMKFAKSLVSKDTDVMVFNSIRQNKNNFSRIVDKIIDKPSQESKITRETAIQNLNIPAKYYIDRGFSETTLNKYDVGLCQNPQKPMYNRVVVPVYDNSGKYLVGCTGRNNVINVNLTIKILNHVQKTIKRGYTPNGNTVKVLNLKIIYIIFGMLKNIFKKIIMPLL